MINRRSGNNTNMAISDIFLVHVTNDCMANCVGALLSRCTPTKGMYPAVPQALSSAMPGVSRG